jgi:hypothetical protein
LKFTVPSLSLVDVAHAVHVFVAVVIRPSCRILIFFFVALRPNAGHGLLIPEVSRSHTQRRTTVGRTPLDE